MKSAYSNKKVKQNREYNKGYVTHKDLEDVMLEEYDIHIYDSCRNSE